MCAVRVRLLRKHNFSVRSCVPSLRARVCSCPSLRWRVRAPLSAPRLVSRAPAPRYPWLSRCSSSSSVRSRHSLSLGQPLSHALPPPPTTTTTTAFKGLHVHRSSVSSKSSVSRQRGPWPTSRVALRELAKGRSRPGFSAFKKAPLSFIPRRNTWDNSPCSVFFFFASKGPPTPLLEQNRDECVFLTWQGVYETRW